MPHTPVRPDSLGRRLVVATLLFSVVFTVVTATIRTWIAWRSNVVAMNDELKLIDKAFNSGLSKNVWDLDLDVLRDQLKDLATINGVGSVEVKLLRAGRPAEVFGSKADPRYAGSDFAVLHRVLTYEGAPGRVETIGELTLEGDDRILWNRISNELAGIVLTQAIQAAGLAAIIIVFFNNVVTLHVRKIAIHLSRITPATLNTRLELQRNSARPDELSMLVVGINDLQSKLLEYFNRQLANERDLALHRDELAKLVDEQTAELRAANADLEALSRSDPLTNLSNRRHFDEVKEAEFRRAKRIGHPPLSVLICDIDFFKLYNDTYGHAAGDRCLASVAEVFRRAFGRAGDLAARIGGEEFAVILPSADLASAKKSADHLRALLTDRAIEHSASAAAPFVTLSIGAAELDLQTMRSFDDLLERADEALYRAKNGGRNRVEE